jgi:hypothetical protein
LDKSGAGDNEDERGGEMQITFAPALSEAIERRIQGGEGGRAEMETSLDTYKRKEKERREKRKEAKKNGGVASRGTPDDEDGEAQEEEAVGFDDPFFDQEPDFEAALANDSDGGDYSDAPGPSERPKSSKAKPKLTKAEREAADRQRAELALLVDSESDDDVGGGDFAAGSRARHFDMEKIIKAEKAKGKGKKKNKKNRGKEKEAVKDDFEIDVADDRFKSLHEDPEFAIDPSNPQCVFLLGPPRS